MALKAKVEDLEAVPEEARGFYTQTDDGYRLDAEGVEFEDDVQELKSALSQERRWRKEFESRAGVKLTEAAEEIPDDWQDRLEEWEQLKEKEKERERKKAEEKGEFDKLRSQLKEQYQEKEEEWQSKLQRVETQLEQKIVDEAIMSAASEHDAYAHLLPEYAKRFVRVEEKNGQRVPVVVDEDGDRRINNEGEPMSISELVASMKERYQPLFKPSGATGGGAASGSGAGGSMPNKSIKEMSDQEKQDFIDEHGLDAWSDKIRETYRV